MKTHPQKGWPPDGADGEWLGWDDAGVLTIMRWMPDGPKGKWKAGWWCMRFDPQYPAQGARIVPADWDGRQMPLVFTRSPETEHYVTTFRPAIGARGE